LQNEGVRCVRSVLGGAAPIGVTIWHSRTRTRFPDAIGRLGSSVERSLSSLGGHYGMPRLARRFFRGLERNRIL